MTPSGFCNDTTNCIVADMKASRNVMSLYPGCRQGPDCNDRFIGEFREPVGASSPDSFSAFFDSIPNVVFLRTKKQMFRSYARRVIAMMTHAKSFRNCAIGKFVAETMRVVKDSSMFSNSHFAVTSYNLKLHPYPAVASFINIRPETNDLFRG